jgi:hypothetical protein
MTSSSPSSPAADPTVTQPPEQVRHSAAVVFHPGGALGDLILTWPLLRTLATRGRTTLITAPSRGMLTQHARVCAAANSEAAWASALWQPAIPCAPAGDVQRVISFSHDPTWLVNAARAFPRANITPVIGPADRNACLALALAHGATDDQITPARVVAPTSPPVIHIGAGAESKRVPLDAWLHLARPSGAALLAGEVESARLTPHEHAAFLRAGGTFIDSLTDLADRIHAAPWFAGADSGPAHLAAQLGVPTVAVFGHTDPASWAPIGHTVAAVRAPDRRAAADLEADWVTSRVTRALAALVGDSPLDGESDIVLVRSRAQPRTDGDRSSVG